MKSVFKYISIYFHGILYFLSGNFYSYDPVFNEGNRNGIPLSGNKANEHEQKIKELKFKEELSKKINFLGYKTTPHCIFFYSFFHLYFYFVFLHDINYYSLFITKIFQNSFLILVYVMFSLIIIDKAVPPIFELLIDIFSKLSFKAEGKSIKL